MAARFISSDGLPVADTLALARLLQLASPTLPVGAFSYSQGLEWMIDDGRITDETAVAAWLEDGLELVFARADGPWLAALWQAGAARDWACLAELNQRVLASRETRELRAETVQMGYSLRQLAPAVLPADAPALQGLSVLVETAFPTAYALIACDWGISQHDTLTGYAWGWLENQVMAAVKSVPLGQTAGQRLLLQLGTRLPAAVDAALRLPEGEVSSSLPGLAHASSRHEAQYSRLFRS